MSPFSLYWSWFMGIPIPKYESIKQYVDVNPNTCSQTQNSRARIRRPHAYACRHSHTSKQESILELIWIVSCMQLQFSSNLSATTRIGCKLLTSNIVIGGPDALRNSEVRGDCQEPKDRSHGAECGSGRCHAETSNNFPATWQCRRRELKVEIDVSR